MADVTYYVALSFGTASDGPALLSDVRRAKF
jgi:hypothetical protein